MTAIPSVPTRTKIAFARQLYRLVMAPRQLLGMGTAVRVRRNGILWDLDLREGIDLAIYLLGAFERSTMRAYRGIVRPGDTVFDIGANVGAHTLPLARAVGSGGQVVAFEATDGAFAKLGDNLKLNPTLALRVVARQSFLSDLDGRPPAHPVYASWPVDSRAAAPDTHPLHLGVPASTRGAKYETLDSAWEELGRPTVAFIKLDVDGNEPAVLRGGARLLQEQKPTILTELAPYGHVERGENPGVLESLLGGAGYRLYDLRGRVLSAAGGSTVRPGASINVVARPK